MTSLLLSLLLHQGYAPRNPVLQGADPHAAVVGDTVWVYPTDATHRIGSAFWAFSSRDLKTWTEHGPILKFDDIPWIRDDKAPWHGAWAPALAQKGKKFYLYYSVGPQNAPPLPPSRLGVAVGDSPAGPFKDSGRPLVTGGNGFEAIDPMVFRDPKSGQYLLYAGGSAGAKLRVWELDDAMTGVRREIPVETPKEFTEGAFVHYRKGTYYLSYSHGWWQGSSYSVSYSTASTPLGPWTYRGSILQTNGTHKGPGHHSIVQKGDQWAIVFHEWPGREGDGPYEGSRSVSIAPLAYGKDGLIQPVQIPDAPPKW